MRRNPARMGLLAVLPLVVASASCGTSGASTTNLMNGVTPQHVAASPATDAFNQGVAEFAAGLLNQVATGHDNVLLSPLSAELALTLAANGAGGDTLSQMQQVLAGGSGLADWNAMLSGYLAGLPNTDGAKFHTAQSIWCNNARNVKVEPTFLQTNADYYGAGVYSTPFNDQAVIDINAWVKQNTDGMIPKMLDGLDPDAALVLLNALAFDAKWLQPYDDNQVQDGTFTSADGAAQKAKFMSSMEYTYIDDGMATGFLKPYQDGAYNFVALLPKPGVSMTSYLQTLTSGGWLKTMNGANQTPVLASLPKFSFSYATSLAETLKALGMPDAFGGMADFSRMGSIGGRPLYISDVLQKTFIDVTQVGTRAGAATAVIMAGSGLITEPPVVTLDRPFVFAIADASSNLPLFIGVVNNVQ